MWKLSFPPLASVYPLAINAAQMSSGWSLLLRVLLKLRSVDLEQLSSQTAYLEVGMSALQAWKTAMSILSLMSGYDSKYLKKGHSHTWTAYGLVCNVCHERCTNFASNFPKLPQAEDTWITRQNPPYRSSP